MSFKEAISAGFAGYFDFDTRTVRSGYWYWVLFALLAGIVARGIDLAVFGMHSMPVLNLLVSLALLIPGLAVGVRRLHDINRSGWWLLIAFVPIVGVFVVIYWLVQPGTSGDNDFGGDPMGAGSQTPEISVR